MVAKYFYDAFGNTSEIFRSPLTTFEHRFSTKPFTSGQLYDFGHRFYSPKLARWIIRDPIQETDSLNLYLGMRNRSLQLIDPTGLSCCGPNIDSWLMEEISIWTSWILQVNSMIETWAAEDAAWLEPNFVREKAYAYAFMLLIGKKLTYYPDTQFKSDDCPSKDCSNTVTLYGKCIHSSEIGNFLYSIIARYFRMTWIQTWGGSIAGNRGKRSEQDIASVYLGYHWVDSGISLSEYLKKESERFESMQKGASSLCSPCSRNAINGHVKLPPVTSDLKHKFSFDVPD